MTTVVALVVGGLAAHVVVRLSSAVHTRMLKQHRFRGADMKNGSTAIFQVREAGVRAMRHYADVMANCSMLMRDTISSSRPRRAPSTALVRKLTGGAANLSRWRKLDRRSRRGWLSGSVTVARGQSTRINTESTPPHNTTRHSPKNTSHEPIRSLRHLCVRRALLVSRQTRRPRWARCSCLLLLWRLFRRRWRRWVPAIFAPGGHGGSS